MADRTLNSQEAIAVVALPTRGEPWQFCRTQGDTLFFFYWGPLLTPTQKWTPLTIHSTLKSAPIPFLQTRKVCRPQGRPHHCQLLLYNCQHWPDAAARIWNSHVSYRITVMYHTVSGTVTHHIISGTVMYLSGTVMYHIVSGTVLYLSGSPVSIWNSHVSIWNRHTCDVLNSQPLL